MVAASIADAIGAPEGAIKLILSILLGYPLAFFHRLPAVHSLSPSIKHIAFTLEGLALCYYNFGINTFHTWLNVTIIYLVLLLFGGTKFSVIFVFVFNTCYLVIGYYTQISYHEFGISWTMPHCVLTLRLTGVAYDYYDGQKVKDKPSAQDEVVLLERPGYLEMLGHTFFFGGVLVGPQFAMKRYLNFVKKEYSDEKTGGPPDSIGTGLKRMAGGLGYILIFQVLAMYLPDRFLYSPDFEKLGLLTKCALVLIWGKNALHKYIGIWLLQEGSIIVTGMSCVKDKDGAINWDACTNIRVYQLETGESFSDFIQSFNVNTNQWMGRYIYKRLKFLGNKIVSQVLTLFYLALWHGLQSGYYMCFFLELLETNAESQVIWALNKLRSNGYIPDLHLLRPLGRLIRKLLLMFLWSYALVSFVLLDYSKWITVYQSMYFIGHVGCFAALIGGHFLRRALRQKTQANGVHTENTDKVENVDKVENKMDCKYI